MTGKRRVTVIGTLVLVGLLWATGLGPRGVGPDRSAGTVPLGSVERISYPDDGVLAHGDAVFAGSPVVAGVAAPVVAMAATPDGRGYWLAGADGQVFAYGGAHDHGSARLRHLDSPVVGIAATLDGQGYWLATAAGGVYAFGDARNHGSDPVRRVRAPIVAIVATADSKGYWLVNDKGGVESFGDARWHGGLSHKKLSAPVVGMAATPDDGGYWMVTGAGVIHAFGDAARLHVSHPADFTSSVAGISAMPSGTGFWIVADNGQVASYGAAGYYGSNAAVFPVQPDVTVLTTPDGRGYWLLEPDAFPTTFTRPGGGSALGDKIVAEATSQVNGDSDATPYCNSYGPCEPWCALFATWAWEAAGIDIPRYGFTGDIYDWAAVHTRVLSAGSTPAPGDDVLYGTGPQSTSTSFHVGIVAQVWPDGFIDTVEGDAGPAPTGHYGVVINGPYLPSQSQTYNEMPIYGYAVP